MEEELSPGPLGGNGKGPAPSVDKLPLGTSVCASVKRASAVATSGGLGKLERESNFQPRTWRVVSPG